MKSQSVKIAILNFTIGVVDRGGEVGMKMLAEDLTELGYRVDVYSSKRVVPKPNYHHILITLPAMPDADKPTSFIGKVLERLYLDKNGLLILWFTIKSLPHLWRGKYAIFFPVNGFWEILGCKLVRLFKGGKIVISGKAGIGWTDRDSIKLNPDLFVPISKAAADWAKSINPNLNIRYIPEAIDTAVFQTQQKLPLKLKPPIVLCVAAFTHYKRVDSVIRAVALIPDVSLLMVGFGEQEQTLRQLAQSLIPNRHQFLKAQYQDLPQIYQSVSLFTLASQPQEAFGRVLIEALAAGLPVVTTDDPIRRSLLGKVGVYVDPLDPKAYAQALKDTLANPLPKSSYKKQAHTFDRKTIAKQYYQAFLELVR